MSVDVLAPYRNIVTGEQLRTAVDQIPRTMQLWRGQEGPRWRLTVSPGSVQLGTRDYGKANRAENDAFERALRDNAAMTDVLERPAAPTRGNITEWSSESRARMVRRLCTLDYTQLVEGGKTPAMVTLTLPGDWRTVAGTPDDFKAIVNKFRKRYTYAWGHDMIGVWKMEFQRRGAPHLHILTSPPEGLSRGSQLGFKEWLGKAWSTAVGHPDPVQRLLNEQRGTGIDYEDTLRYGDAKRIAVYFTKHGTFKEKEYQNQMPPEWQGLESGGVRFWGYWKLPVLEETVELTDNAQIVLARHFRKLQKSQSWVRKETVYRVDMATGEIRSRRANRRVRYMRNGRGFLSLNNGAVAATDISRIIRHHIDSADFFSPVPNKAPRSVFALHDDFNRERAAVADELMNAR